MARPTNPTAKHRRDVWTQMVLPVAGVGLLILLALVGLFTLAAVGTWDAKQIETVASVMMMICILTPLVIVMLVLNAAAAAIAVGTGKIPAVLKPLLEKLRLQTEGVMKMIETLALNSSRPFISIATRWERWQQFILKLWDRQSSDDRETQQGTDNHE